MRPCRRDRTSSIRWRDLPPTLALAIAVAACVATPSTPPTVTPGAAPLTDVVIEVSQTETCGCCGEWVGYLEGLGAVVEVTYVHDLAASKPVSMPGELGSCHTATVGGYDVEGHVPAAAIVDLLETAPDIDGIALPGMPTGSPGMTGQAEEPFEALSFTGQSIDAFGLYDCGRHVEAVARCLGSGRLRPCAMPPRY